MNEQSPRQIIAEQLDGLLLAHHAKREEVRRAERSMRDLEDEARPLEVEAQRLRLALFALDGETKHAGDANSANHHRLVALLNAHPETDDSGSTDG